MGSPRQESVDVAAARVQLPLLPPSAHEFAEISRSVGGSGSTSLSRAAKRNTPSLSVPTTAYPQAQISRNAARTAATAIRLACCADAVTDNG